MAKSILLKSVSVFQGLFAIILLMPGLAATAQTSRAISNIPSANTESEFVPKGLARLTQTASWHTDFTFDRSMLALAGKLEGLDEPTRQAIARLNGVTVHSYRYATPNAYDEAELASIRSQYDALGWKHIVAKNGNAGHEKPAPDQTPRPGRSSGQTDVWLRMDGMNVAGVAVLLAEPTNVNLVSVSGDVSTIDLLHLRGHFGIPKFDPEDIGK